MNTNRPRIVAALGGENKDFMSLLEQVRAHLTGAKLEQFNAGMRALTFPGTLPKYTGVLAYINSFVQLVDTSGSYSDYMDKPKLVINMAGTDGNIYMVITAARKLVPSDQLNSFLVEVLDAQQPGANKTYEDLLAIINSYVDLVDSSGMYPAYTPIQPETDV